MKHDDGPHSESVNRSPLHVSREEEGSLPNARVSPSPQIATRID